VKIVTKDEIYKVLYDFYFNKLKFCGCGSPEDTLLYIKKLLNLIKRKMDRPYDESKKERDNAYWQYQKDLLFIGGFTPFFNENNKIEPNDIQNGVIQFILYYLDEVEVLEHGGSIGGAWLTEYGEKILECLNACDDLSYIIEYDYQDE
jgi:hypothetical protein